MMQTELHDLHLDTRKGRLAAAFAGLAHHVRVLATLGTIDTPQVEIAADESWFDVHWRDISLRFELRWLPSDPIASSEARGISASSGARSFATMVCLDRRRLSMNLPAHLAHYRLGHDGAFHVLSAWEHSPSLNVFNATDVVDLLADGVDLSLELDRISPPLGTLPY